MLKCLFGYHTWGHCDCPDKECNVKKCIYCGININNCYYAKDVYTDMWQHMSENEYNLNKKKIEKKEE